MALKNLKRIDKEKTKTSVRRSKKTENNVDVARNRIRKKQNVPQEEDLRKYLTNLLIEKG